MNDAPSQSATAPRTGAAPRNVGVTAEVRNKLLTKPFVRKALELSNGSLIDVVPRDSSSPPASEPNGEDESGEMDTE